VKNYEALVNSKSPEDERFCLSLEQLSGVQGIASPRLLIALSGGLDSVVLLYMAERWQKIHKGTVRAVYVDHQLQSISHEWAEHCAFLCDQLKIPFIVQTVSVDLQSGLSPEAAARDARYLAFEDLIEDKEFLCTAHHADDQAETLLLQLFRGAGVAGLAAMPEQRCFGSGYLVRPLLQFTRSELKHYAERHKLVWCEDPSNTDTRYDRNFLRHELMPSIAKRWPASVNSVSRSASHCREALSLLNDLALLDLEVSDINRMPSELPLGCLETLSVARCKNALRCWIINNGYQAPSQAQLQQILSDLINADDESHGRISFGQAHIARYRQTLFIGARGDFDPAADFEYQFNPADKLTIHEANWTLDVADRPRLQAYRNKLLLVRNRRGGEKWRPADARNTVSVKSLLQQRKLPPWQRSRLALVFYGDVLIDICGPGFHL